jgi:anti-sigma B factor antagonist
MALEIERRYEKEKNIWIIEPKGDIDIFSSPQFKETLLGVIEEGQDVLIDGSQLAYIDSTGLGVLISGLKKIKENNKNIAFQNIKPNVEKLFSITGLDKIFLVGEN